MDYKLRGLPVLSVSGESIPEAWENSVLALNNEGIRYERAGPKDKGRSQLDSTMMIEIANPLSDLFWHKCSTCTPGDLIEYQMEILGAKDSWVDKTGKTTYWPYHYHERLADYPGKDGPVNQLEEIIKKLLETPFKRNMNAVTWVPEKDFESKDPPCLQRIWFTQTPDPTNPKSRVLSMNYNFRSRNVMIAAPMNQFGLATLFKYVAEEAEKRTGGEIAIGRMVDFVDSYHVSAQDHPLLEKAITRIKRSHEEGEPIGDRAYSMKDLWSFVEEAHPKAEQKIIEQTGKMFKEYGRTKGLEEEIAKIKAISARVMKINREIAA